MSRKRDAYLPARTPSYVDAKTGAAELCISESTWNDWVKAGVLPPPTKWLGISRKSPRWRWKDIDAYLSGRMLPDEQPPIEAPPDDAAEPFFGDIANAKAQKRKSPSPARRSMCHQKERAEVLLLSGAPRHG